MDWKLLALVTIASGIGVGARYLLAGWTTMQEIPSGTLLVNAVGCLLIGILMFGGLVGGWLDPGTRVVLGIGLLGGFTTMSTFTYETVALAETGQGTLALGNVVVTMGVCLGATWAGRALGHAVWGGGA